MGRGEYTKGDGLKLGFETRKHEDFDQRSSETRLDPQLNEIEQASPLPPPAERCSLRPAIMYTGFCGGFNPPDTGAAHYTVPAYSKCKYRSRSG